MSKSYEQQVEELNKDWQENPDGTESSETIPPKKL